MFVLVFFSLTVDDPLDSTEELIQEGERLDRHFTERPQAEAQVILVKTRCYGLTEKNKHTYTNCTLLPDLHLLLSHFASCRLQVEGVSFLNPEFLVFVACNP